MSSRLKRRSNIQLAASMRDTDSNSPDEVKFYNISNTTEALKPNFFTFLLLFAVFLQRLAYHNFGH